MHIKQQEREIRFGDLYSISSRNGVSKPKKVRGAGYPMVNMGEIFKFDRIDDMVSMELVPLTTKEREQGLLERGDLLFARQSLVAEGAGKCSVFLGANQKTTFESHLIRVRLKKDVADPVYYFYYFSSPKGKGKTQSLVMQVAAAGIRGSELENLMVDYLPLKTQKAVAGVLSAYDDLIENNNRRTKILEEIAKKVYIEWFINFRYPGWEKVEFGQGGLPKGWNRLELSNCISIYRGKSYSSEDLVENEKSIPFINLKCIRRFGGFRKDGVKLFSGSYKETQKVSKGDVVMAVTDMTQERMIVARVARIPFLDGGFAVISMDLIKIEPKENCEKDFLYSFLRWSDFSDHVKNHANGANVLHLSPDRVTDYKFICPPITLQKMFSEFVRSLFDEIDSIQLVNENLQQMRDLLMPQLVTGKLEINV